MNSHKIIGKTNKGLEVKNLSDLVGIKNTTFRVVEQLD
jgi:hypothetical protein